MSLEAAKARGHPKSREPGETRVDHENPGLQQFGFPPWRPSRLRVSHSGIFNRLLGSPLFRKRSGSRQGAKPRSRSGDGPTWRRFPGFSISAFSFSGRLPERDFRSGTTTGPCAPTKKLRTLHPRRRCRPSWRRAEQKHVRPEKAVQFSGPHDPGQPGAHGSAPNLVVKGPGYFGTLCPVVFYALIDAGSDAYPHVVKSYRNAIARGVCHVSRYNPPIVCEPDCVISTPDTSSYRIVDASGAKSDSESNVMNSSGEWRFPPPAGSAHRGPTAQVLVHPRQGLRPHFRCVHMAQARVDDALERVLLSVEVVYGANGRLDDANAVDR